MNQIPHSPQSVSVDQNVESAPSVSSRMQLRAMLIGFLVYYGLFASYGRLYSVSSNMDPWTRALGIPKLIVFAATMWLVARGAGPNRKRYIISGAFLAIIGSFLLLVIESELFPVENPIIRVPVEAIEAVGEALMTAGLTAFIRIKTSGHDWEYFHTTTSLRIGQNSGMVLAVILGHQFWPNHATGYAAVLLVSRVIALGLVLQFVRDKFIVDSVGLTTRFSSRERANSRKRFRLDALVGALSYALFYLAAIGSPRIIGDKDNVWLYLAINGGFAVLSMLIILIVSPAVRLHSSAPRAVLKFETVTGIGTGIVILWWIVSLYLSSGSAVSPFYLILSAGVLGFFTTSTYVIGELSSGLHGKPSSRTRQIIYYFAFSRWGPVAALLMILFLPPRSNLSTITLSVVGAICGGGVILGVLSKKKYERIGGEHEQIKGH